MPIKPEDRVLYLNDKPVEVTCPACWSKGYTIVEIEPSTCCHDFLYYFLVCCKTEHREFFQDRNHYCGKCGCYIGRMLPPSTYLTKT